MTEIKPIFQKIALAGTMAGLFFNIASFPLLGEVQLTQTPSPAEGEPLNFVLPPLSDREAEELEDLGAPDDTEQAGTRRGDCPALLESESGLTVLAPIARGREETEPSEFVFSLTIAEYPTFWMYMPYSSEDVHSVKFVMLDEQKSYFTQELVLPLSGTPGIVSFRLPSTKKPLEIGKLYRWFLVVDCQPPSASDVEIGGVVKRVESSPEMMRQIETATPREQVAIYAENGIWHEAIALLGELRRASPQDAKIAADWAALFASVGLEHLAQTSVVECCTIEQ